MEVLLVIMLILFRSFNVVAKRLSDKLYIMVVDGIDEHFVHRPNTAKDGNVRWLMYIVVAVVVFLSKFPAES